jgi:hypothetical protein
VAVIFTPASTAVKPLRVKDAVIDIGQKLGEKTMSMMAGLWTG